MDHAAAFVMLLALLTAHNAGLDEEDADLRVDAPATLKQVKRHGGTTLDGLLVMNAKGFTDCGFPPATAELAVKKLREATTVPDAAPERVMGIGRGGLPGVVMLRDERSAMEAESDASLISRYDHAMPGVIGEILDKRANGRPFLVFVGDKPLVEPSAERLALLKRGRPVGEFVEVEGRMRRPFKVGEPLKSEAMKQNPLYVHLPLQEPGEVCSVTKESWAGISAEIRGILEIAVREGELTLRDPEAARAIIEKARRTDGLAKVRAHYAASAYRWDEMPERERPSGDYDPRQARQEGRRGLPFQGGAQGTRNG